MKYTLLVLLILLVTDFNLAQVVKVLDSETSEPLEFVTIISNTPKAITVTNGIGEANLKLFQSSEGITFQLIGYEKLIITFSEISDLDFIIKMNTSSISLDQVVVSATKWVQSSRELSSKVSIITPKDVELQNPQTSADLLNISGDVFIQKSQQGGGSPMIRGFATNRVLITVDGIRMNNAIFRSGNVQNVISIDPFSIENTEILFGPGSTIYGSDAIGGSMNFYTLRPQFSISSNLSIGGHAQYRYSSANNENTGHIDLNLGWSNFASLTSISFNSFDNLMMGSEGPESYLRNEFVKRLKGTDTVVVNSDPRTQYPTNYDQLNFLQKFRYKADEHWLIDYSFYYSETSKFDRYDRLTRYSDGLLSSAEWYYGPQKWLMNNITITNFNSNPIYDDLVIRLGYQFFEESRNDRNFKNTDLRKRKENVDAYSINFDLNSTINDFSSIKYGFEAVINDVNSEGTIVDITTGMSSQAAARYPAATWTSLAGYLVYQNSLSNQLIFQSGLRYNYFNLSAEFDTTFYPLPFTSSDLSNSALTGSVGLAYNPTSKWSLGVNISTGFRSPNVDDIGKVFDSEPGAVVVPNPNLKAEYAYNFDIGIAKIFSDRLKIDMTTYYTILSNAMVRRDYSLNGVDSIYYDGKLSQVQAIQNASNAYVWGIQAGIELSLFKNFNITSQFNFQKGEEELADGSKSSLRHAAPFFSSTHISYKYNKFKANLSFIYNGEINNSNLAEEEKSKINIYALDGNGNPYSPSWYTLNIKLLYAFTNNFSLIFGLENITDQRYRTYSSGISAAGRNFVSSLRLKF